MIIRQLPVHVAGTIRKRGLLQPGNTVIVALSGGADSCALLDLLANLPDFPLRLIAAHLNHSLRGADSDADEEFARSLAARYGIPFESRRSDVTEYAEKHRLNLEEAGRNIRYAFFGELMAGHKADALALGHHRDDQAETVLMRLLRGSGAAGLSAMPFSNRRGHIRPLLDVTRNEIESYLTERGLTWRDDVSNSDTVFLRNRIRHELLPVLEQYNPGIRECLAATAGMLAEDNELLESLADREYESLAKPSVGSSEFDISTLKNLHPALFGRVIRSAVSRLSGTLANLSRDHVAAVAAMLTDGRPNKSINLPGAITAVREYGHLRIENAVSDCEVPGPVKIEGPGSYSLWSGMQLEVSVVGRPDQLKDTPSDTAYHDLARAPFPWEVRTFKTGDAMIPFGMTGSKKVKDIFIDAKIPPHLRRIVPLVFSLGRLTWICGLRFSSCASITDSSTEIAKTVLNKMAKI